MYVCDNSTLFRQDQIPGSDITQSSNYAVSAMHLRGHAEKAAAAMCCYTQTSCVAQPFKLIFRKIRFM